MILAYQFDPEYQESPFEAACWPGIIFTGNNHYLNHIPDGYNITAANGYETLGHALVALKRLGGENA